MLTISRGAAVVLAGLAALPGCAARQPPAPVVGVAARSAAVSYGVIVTTRPVREGGAGDVRGAILTALGGTATPAAPGGLTEFIVRADDGRTLSVVQGNTPGLRTGGRVTIAQGPGGMLVRTAQAAPGG